MGCGGRSIFLGDNFPSKPYKHEAAVMDNYNCHFGMNYFNDVNRILNYSYWTNINFDKATLRPRDT